jgi:hypothetical protein
MVCRGQGGELPPRQPGGRDGSGCGVSSCQVVSRQGAAADGSTVGLPLKR